MRLPSTLIVFSLTLLAALAEVRAASNRKSRCSPEREREMDLCASRMGFLGDHSFRVPKNSTSCEKFCSELKTSITCLQAYSRDCLQGFTKQIFTSLMKRGKQQHSSICSNQDSRRNFMTKLGCLTDDKIETFHNTMDASVARFEYISNRVKHENKLPSLCCSYQIFGRDLDATLNSICGRQSGSGSVNEYISKIVGGTAGEFFNLICDNHRSLEECRKSAKTSSVLDNLEEQTRRVKEGQLKPKNKSLVPVLLQILDSSEAK